MDEGIVHFRGAPSGKAKSTGILGKENKEVTDENLGSYLKKRVGRRDEMRMR